MTRIILALLVFSSVASRASAQETVSAGVLQAAQKLVGSATVTGAHVVAGDSLLIEVYDAPYSFQAVQDGLWKFGGREDYAKDVGREVAVVILAGLSSSPAVKVVLVNVRGADKTTLQLNYVAAELRRPRDDN